MIKQISDLQWHKMNVRNQIHVARRRESKLFSAKHIAIAERTNVQ